VAIAVVGLDEDHLLWCLWLIRSGVTPGYRNAALFLLKGHGAAVVCRNGRNFIAGT
jgi:hypothetical protein